VNSNLYHLVPKTGAALYEAMIKWLLLMKKLGNVKYSGTTILLCIATGRADYFRKPLTGQNARKVDRTDSKQELDSEIV
jgi:hypothetical protein